VLERWPQVYPLPRAVHFDDEVFRIFADMHLADEVGRHLPAATRHAAHRPEAPGARRAQPDATAHGYPQSNMFDQPALERVLRTALNRYPSVELRSGADVAEIAEVAGGPRPGTRPLPRRRPGHRRR
jgi:3-(3-hydroxy-phenyl)propionate hydroxylase